MEAQIKLGRVFGIEIGLHYSWLLIALLVAFSLGTHFQMVNPEWGTGIVWTTAIVTALLFFAAIVLHELSHAAVAKMRGLPVRSITLFALGGVAQIEREAADAKTEFWMGIVGPITSAVIGFVCLMIAFALGWQPSAEEMATAATPPSMPAATGTQPELITVNGVKMRSTQVISATSASMAPAKEPLK